MQGPLQTIAIQRKVLESKGSEKSDLLGVLRQALHHNAANSYHLGMTVGFMSGDENAVFDSVSTRAALVDRHVLDAQRALEELRELAKTKGYKDITAIFEKTYFVGWSQDT